MLHHQELLFVSIIIQTKLISCHYNDFLTSNFGFDKTKKLIGRKYYWLSLRKDFKDYIKCSNVYLLSKAIKQKFYSELQSFPITTH